MSLGAVRDWSWAGAMTNGRGGLLREIWVRDVTDLLDPRVPLFIETMPGGSSSGNLDRRHQVQVPPGVQVRQLVELRSVNRMGPRFDIPRGGCFCVYSDGTYRKYPPRESKLFFPGANLLRRTAK